MNHYGNGYSFSYKLENLPLVGFMFEIILDGSITIDTPDILLEGLTPLLFKGLDIAKMLAQLFHSGVNTVIAASLDCTLSRTTEWFIADEYVIGLFMNIQRKQ